MEDRLYELHRNASKQIIWQPGQKEKIISQYTEENLSMRKIAEIWNISKTTVKKILLDKQYITKTPAQSHYKDKRKDNIFSFIDTEEKAYWLGFLYADGCVCGNYIILALQKRDRNHIEKFQKFIGCSSVQIIDYQKVDTKGRMKDYSRLSFGCKPIAEDLKSLGCFEKKSLILQPPNIPQEFEMDFIRGYFDGDGCISYSKKSNRWQGTCASTKALLNWMVEKLDLNTKPYREVHYGIPANVYLIHFNGRKRVYNTFNKMYRDNQATIYLERKYNLYLQLRSSFNTVN